MSEEIKNDIDKLDGMVKMKKCGYEFIGGCSDLRRLKQENAKLKEENFKLGQIDIKKVTLVENRQLEEENKKLKEKLEKIKEFIMHCYYDDTVKCNWSDNLVVPNCEYINECNYKPIDYLLHNIIEGAEDE